MLLVLVFVFSQIVLAKNGNEGFQAKSPYIEVQKTDYPQNIALAKKETGEDKTAGQIEITDQYLISDIPENEFLDKYPDLKSGFQDITLSLEADEPIFDGENFQKPQKISVWQKIKSLFGLKIRTLAEYKRLVKEINGSENIQTTLDLSQISLTTKYKETEAIAPGSAPNPIKQEIILDNKGGRDLNLNLKIKHQIKADKVTWDDKEYEVNPTPQVFKGYEKTETIPEFAKTLGKENLEGAEEFKNYTWTYAAGTRLIFKTTDGASRAFYDWSDIPEELAPEVSVSRIKTGHF